MKLKECGESQSWLILTYLTNVFLEALRKVEVSNAAKVWMDADRLGLYAV
jgi:hypothetical protein